MRSKGKQILSVLLVCCLLLGLVPAAVLADDAPPPLDGTETVLDLDRLTGESVGELYSGGAWYYDASTKVLTIYGKDDQGGFTLTGGGPGSGVWR